MYSGLKINTSAYRGPLISSQLCSCFICLFIYLYNIEIEDKIYIWPKFYMFLSNDVFLSDSNARNRVMQVW